MKGQQGGPIHSEPEGGQRSNSLEDVAREPQATPGLQQLTWIFPIQLQIFNGVDDLGMHVPDSAQWKGRGRRQREWGELNGEGKVQEPNTNVVNRLSERIHPPPQKVITYNEQMQASVLNSKRPLIWWTIPLSFCGESMLLLLWFWPDGVLKRG